MAVRTLRLGTTALIGAIGLLSAFMLGRMLSPTTALFAALLAVAAVAGFNSVWSP